MMEAEVVQLEGKEERLVPPMSVASIVANSFTSFVFLWTTSISHLPMVRTFFDKRQMQINAYTSLPSNRRLKLSIFAMQEKIPS